MSSEKLVRDRIPEIVRQNDGSLTFRRASPNEMELLLREKLVEEALEFRGSGDVEELADILEVIRSFIRLRNVSWDDLERLRHAKREQRGGFEQGFVLQMIEP